MDLAGLGASLSLSDGGADDGGVVDVRGRLIGDTSPDREEDLPERPSGREGAKGASVLRLRSGGV